MPTEKREMLNDVSDIMAMYNRDTQREHNRLLHHRLEFDITRHLLAKYIKSGASILEIGCATGRYTLEMLQRGVRVTAVDFSERMIAHSKRYLSRHGFGGKVAHYRCDARDLGALPRATYDAVLLMGPLYHLVDLADRKQALRQAHGRLKKGGLLFSAFISRYGIYGDVMKKVPHWVEEGDAAQWVLTKGYEPTKHPPGSFRGYYATPQEIPKLHRACGFEMLELAAVEPAIAADDASYNALKGKRRRLWLELLLRLINEPSCLGASRHLLYVGKRMPDDSVIRKVKS